VSDTPISDSTPHNVAELGMLCRRLERKLSATRKYLSQVTERINQLETENDELRADLLLWNEKEVKP
jgi:HPt (histidine-containing phosphotransfer) domain-containing protein